jgi:hypothetical protein
VKDNSIAATLKRVVTVALLVAIASLLAASAAGARHGVSGKAKKTILRGESVPGLTKAPTASCEDVWTSTVGRAGPSWAFDLTIGSAKGACANYQSGDGAFLHRVGRRWHVVIEGNEWCPVRKIQQVPYAIERDLVGCRQ